MSCSVCGKPTKNKTCGRRCNSIAQTWKVRERRKAAKKARRYACNKCVGIYGVIDAENSTCSHYPKGRPVEQAKAEKEQAPDKILDAIKRKGFVDFRSYLAARTVKADGKRTWTLVEQARDLGVPISSYISYHARWIDERQAIQARQTNERANG